MECVKITENVKCNQCNHLIPENSCIQEVYILVPQITRGMVVLQQVNQTYTLEYNLPILFEIGENILSWCKYNLHARVTGGTKVNIHIHTPETTRLEIIHPLYAPTETEEPHNTQISGTCVQQQSNNQMAYPYKLRFKSKYMTMPSLLSLALMNLEGPDLNSPLHQLDMKIKPHRFRIQPKPYEIKTIV